MLPRVVCCPAGRCWCLRAAECLQLRLHNARVATDSLLVSELGQDWHLLLYECWIAKKIKPSVSILMPAMLTMRFL